MELTLGPVLFNWQADDWRDFYFRIADEAPVETVVVGEVVCSKRMPFFARHLPTVAERLTAAGKEVIFGSLALVALERERRQMEELAKSEDLTVEANDVSVLRHLAGRPHAIGPFVNIYNEATAAFFASRGARRMCLPPELPAASVAAIAAGVPEVMVEVFAFGRVPLAISARCYHARLHKLTKDNCRFVCEKDPDGLAVETLDNEPFLTVNGVQTLSQTVTNLVGDIDLLRSAGIGALRLSPQCCDMVAIARLFREVIDGRREAREAEAALAEVYPGAVFANGFVHAEPGVRRVGA
ncbi:Collagenase-like protease, PrtC family [Chelatococcus sambhunathii]|uniref:Ubiquinone biosynthesis protein UbiV n=1 Tax=Chelatococcus sambhunathii TaxID=363953 RepID=A0ABM9U329_9HYPH|nr:U32 family peptidase [Chelatococcus sambhunathii]CUA87148.1 Collagenase-like protease, PrtC family [Chelatococcus sambhunathii]